MPSNAMHYQQKAVVRHETRQLPSFPIRFDAHRIAFTYGSVERVFLFVAFESFTNTSALASAFIHRLILSDFYYYRFR